MPVLARLGLRLGNGRRLALWIPLPLVYLLLAPVLVLTLPVAVLVVLCLGAAVNPIRLLAVAGRILAATRGTAVEFESREVSFLVHIR
jgi:hypothetical protein